MLYFFLLLRSIASTYDKYATEMVINTKSVRANKLNKFDVYSEFKLTRIIYKPIEPSPLRPQTTIAIERVKTAANAAHANVNNID